MCNTRLGHVHLKVRELDRAVDFYRRHIGMQVVERVGNQYAFLGNGQCHHELALQSVGLYAPAPSQHGTGLYHVAFEVQSKLAFATVYRNLVDAGVELETVDHLFCWSLYFTDPDGNGLEVYWDTRCQPGGRPFWRGRNTPLLAARILEGCDISQGMSGNGSVD